MYKIFVYFIILLAFQSDASGRSWNENSKLSWSDFKGEPNNKIDAVAVTASGITFGYGIQSSSTRGITGFKTEVFAHFYPEKSWCKKEEINDYILKHEQLHFDVTELNVRYLREKISKLKVSEDIASILDTYQKEANVNLEKMQEQYDSESNYSINIEGQVKWNTFVKSELNRLEAYKSQ